MRSERQALTGKCMPIRLLMISVSLVFTMLKVSPKRLTDICGFGRNAFLQRR